MNETRKMVLWSWFDLGFLRTFYSAHKDHAKRWIYEDDLKRNFLLMKINSILFSR